MRTVRFFVTAAFLLAACGSDTQLRNATIGSTLCTMPDVPLTVTIDQQHPLVKSTVLVIDMTVNKAARWHATLTSLQPRQNQDGTTTTAKRESLSFIALMPDEDFKLTVEAWSDEGEYATDTALFHTAKDSDPLSVDNVTVSDATSREATVSFYVSRPGYWEVYLQDNYGEHLVAHDVSQTAQTVTTTIWYANPGENLQVYVILHDPLPGGGYALSHVTDFAAPDDLRLDQSMDPVVGPTFVRVPWASDRPLGQLTLHCQDWNSSTGSDVTVFPAQTANGMIGFTTELHPATNYQCWFDGFTNKLWETSKRFQIETSPAGP